MVADSKPAEIERPLALRESWASTNRPSIVALASPGSAFGAFGTGMVVVVVVVGAIVVAGAATAPVVRRVEVASATDVVVPEDDPGTTADGD